MKKTEFTKGIKSMLKLRVRITEALIVSMLILGINNTAIASTGIEAQKGNQTNECSDEDKNNKEDKKCFIGFKEGVNESFLQKEAMIPNLEGSFWSLPKIEYIFRGVGVAAVTNMIYQKMDKDDSHISSGSVDKVPTSTNEWVTDDATGEKIELIPGIYDTNIWKIGKELTSSKSITGDYTYTNSVTIASTPIVHLIRGLGEKLTIVNKGALVLGANNTSTSKYSSYNPSLFADSIDQTTGAILTGTFKDGIFAGLVEDGAKFINEKEITFENLTAGLRGGLIAYSGSKVTNTATGTIIGQFDIGMGAIGGNSIALNNGILSVGNNKTQTIRYGMYAEQGGSITNNGSITIKDVDIPTSFAMYATDVNSIAINNGELVAKNSEVLLGAANGATAINRSAINGKGIEAKSQVGMVAKGKLASQKTSILNDKNAIITVTNGYGMTAVSTQDSDAAEAINDGTINITDIAVNTKAAMSAYEGATVINSSNGIINANASRGMLAEVKNLNLVATAINEGNINVTTGAGMYSAGTTGATAFVLNKNKITITGEGTGMAAGTNSTATNETTGTITGGRFGMMAEKGGSIVNNGMVSGATEALFLLNGAGSTLVNNNADLLIFNSATASYVKAMGGASFENAKDTTISGTGIALTASGVNSNVVNSGTINASGNYGMVGTLDGTATNTGVISLGASAKGLVATAGGTAINDGTFKVNQIGDDARAIYSTGTDSIAINRANIAEDRMSVILEATNGGTVDNQGTIDTNGKIVMLANGANATGLNSQNINISGGNIDNSAIGMKSINGSTSNNMGTISVKNSAVGMYGEGAGTYIINNSVIDLSEATSTARAMVVSGYYQNSVLARNANILTAGLSDVIMEALDGAKLLNQGVSGVNADINANSKIGMQITGRSTTERASALNDVSGTINVTTGIGMNVISNGELVNSGKINVSTSGKGMEVANNSGTATNIGTIILSDNATGVGMLTLAGGTAGTITLNNKGTIDAKNAYGMIATGKDAVANNEGNITAITGYAMVAEENSTIVNSATGTKAITISGTGIGMLANKATASAVNSGKIVLSNTLTESHAMVAIDGTANVDTLTNSATGNIDAGIGVGMALIGNNSTARNLGVITVSDGKGIELESGNNKGINDINGTKVGTINITGTGIGMYAESGSTLTNNGSILLTEALNGARGIVVTGTGTMATNNGTIVDEDVSHNYNNAVMMEALVNSSIVNGANATINVNEGKAMQAMGSDVLIKSTAINNGIINVGNTAIGMVAGAFSTVTNNASGVKGINVVHLNSIGMQALSNGSIDNLGTITITAGRAMQAKGLLALATNNGSIVLAQGGTTNIVMEAIEGGGVINNKTLGAGNTVGMKAVGTDATTISTAVNSTGSTINVVNGKGMLAGAYGTVTNEGNISVTGTSTARAMLADGVSALAINKGTITLGQGGIVLEAKNGGSVLNEASVSAGNSIGLSATGKMDALTGITTISGAVNNHDISVVNGTGIQANYLGNAINNTTGIINVTGTGTAIVATVNSTTENKGIITIGTGAKAIMASGTDAYAVNSKTIENLTTNASDTSVLVNNAGIFENREGATISGGIGKGISVNGSDANNISKVYNSGAITSSTLGVEVGGYGYLANGLKGEITATGSGDAINVSGNGEASNIGKITVDRGKGISIVGTGTAANGGDIYVGGIDTNDNNPATHDTGIGILADGSGSLVVNNGNIFVTSGIGIKATNGSKVINNGVVTVSDGYCFVAEYGGIIDNYLGNSACVRTNPNNTDTWLKVVGGQVNYLSGLRVNWHAANTIDTKGEVNFYELVEISSGGAAILDHGSVGNIYGVVNIMKMTNDDSIIGDTDATHPNGVENDASGFVMKGYNGSILNNATGVFNIAGTGIGMAAYSNSEAYNYFKMTATEAGTAMLASGIGSKAINSGMIFVGGTSKGMAAYDGATVQSSTNIGLNSVDAIGLYAEGVNAGTHSTAINNMNLTIENTGIMMKAGTEGHISNNQSRIINANAGTAMMAEGLNAIALNSGILNVTIGNGMHSTASGLVTNDATATINITSTGVGMLAKDDGVAGNYGHIIVANGYGMKAEGTIGDSVANNYKSIDITGTGYGMYSTGRGDSTNTIEGVINITGQGYGMYATDDDIINNGTINAGNGVGMTAEWNGTDASIVARAINNKEIKVTNGTGIIATGISAGVTGIATNNSKITIAGSGNGVKALDGGTALNDTKGTINITNAGKGLVAEASGVNTTATNKGTINLVTATAGARALYATGDGALVINDADITAGGSDIIIETTNGGNAVNNADRIINANTKIAMSASGNSATVSNDGVLNVTSGTASRGIRAAAGGIGINNASTSATTGIINVSGTGIGMEALAGGTITNLGAIHLTSNGVAMKASGALAKATNSGLIDTDWVGILNDDSSITHGGLIGDGGSVIENSGTINSNSNFGMVLNSDVLGGSAENKSTGIINVTTGIGILGQGTVASALTNNGTINVKGLGVAMKGTASATNITLENTNVINLLGNDSIGMAGSNNQTISNAVGANINIGNDTDVFTNIVGMTGSSTGMTNAGTISISTNTTLSTGILGASANIVSNTGTITVRGTFNNGMYATTGTISNASTITIDGDNNYGMYARTGATATNNGGTININGGTNVVGIFGETLSTLTNTGDITAIANTIGILQNGVGTDAINGAINSGNITTAGTGMLALVGGTVTNNATGGKSITVTTGAGMVANGTSSQAVNNTSALINVSGTSISMQAEQGGSVTNKGTIDASGLIADRVVMIATGTGSTATNNGTIIPGTKVINTGMLATNGGSVINNSTTLLMEDNGSTYLQASGLESTATNNATLTIEGANENTFLIKVDGGASAINTGTITVTSATNNSIFEATGTTDVSNIVNKGGITTAGTGAIYVNNAKGYITNDVGGSITMSNNAVPIKGFNAQNGGAVKNNGILTMSANTNVNSIAFYATGTGSLAMNNGTVNVNSAMPNIMVSESGGQVYNMSSGVINANTQTGIYGETGLNGGTINVTSGYGMKAISGATMINEKSGIINVTTGIGMSTTGGIINNSGTINLNGNGDAMSISGNNITGENLDTGIINLKVAGSVAMNGVGTSNATIKNSGTINITASNSSVKSIGITGSSTQTLVNGTTGIININSTAGYAVGMSSSTRSLTNLGTINVAATGAWGMDAGKNTATNGSPTNNTATINVSGSGAYAIYNRIASNPNGTVSGVSGIFNNYGIINLSGASQNFGMLPAYNVSYLGYIIQNNYGTINVGSTSGIGLYQRFTYNTTTNQSSGVINVTGNNAIGIEASGVSASSNKITNNGEINISSSTGGKGINGNMGQANYTNNGTITINAQAKKGIGLNILVSDAVMKNMSTGIINVYGDDTTLTNANVGIKINAGSATNSGTINVYGDSNFGVYVKTGSFTNAATGKIKLFGTNGVGIYAEAGTTISNLGIITNADGQSMTNTGSATDTTVDSKGNRRIVTGGAVVLLNAGVMDFRGETFDASESTGFGSFVMQEGGSLVADKVTGEIAVDSNIVSLYSYEGTSKAAITTEELIASIKARAAMFDAWYAKNQEKEKAYDLSIRMKQYKDIVENDNIAKYLQDNYDAEALKSKISGRYTSNYDSGSEAKDRLYNTLNSTTTKEGVNLLASRIVGNDYYPTTQKITFESEKFVNDNIDKNVISKVFADDNELSSYLGTSQTVSKVDSTDTTYGYKNNLSSVAYGNSIKLKNGDKLGGALSINYANAKFDDSDSSTYKFTNYQANLFYGRKLKNGIEFVMSPYYAIGKGNIERKLYTGEAITSDANTHSFGMTTTARKTYNFGNYYLIPVFGISTGEVVQEEIKDESEDGTTVSATTMTTLKPNVEVTVGKVFTVKSDYKINASTVAKYSYELGDSNKAGNGQSNADSMLGNATLSNTKYETNDSSGSIGARIGVSKGNFEVYTDYSHGVGTRSNEDKISGGFSYKF